MSGGIFPGYPFTLNIKCIIFALIIMALYSFRPPTLSMTNNLFVYFIIFVIAYVAMAWYDYFFGCSQLPLQRGSMSFTGQFKPPMHEAAKQGEHLMTEQEVSKNHTLIYALHAIIIVPFLAYIGFRRGNVPDWTYPLLIALAAFTLVYHGVRLMTSSHSSGTSSNST
jgi:hypothetical protein